MKTDNLTSSFMALQDKLRRSAFSFLRNDEDAKDAIQDTFFKLWRNGNVESESEARNKLFAVLKNVCIDKLRKPITLQIDEIDTENLESDQEQYEDVDKFEELITMGLTDTQKQIYSLAIHEGMEYDKIAVLMNISVDAVRMNMSRARRKINETYKRLEK